MIMTLPAALVTVFIVLGGFAGPLAAAATQIPGEEFMLFYGNDVRGEVDPCG
jgi:hypothetical protein